MFRRLARGAEDLVVSFVTDEQDRVIFLGEADSFEMDLGDERASGIDSAEAALGGGGADGRGDAVSAIQHRRALGHFFDVIYEEDTAFAKALDHRRAPPHCPRGAPPASSEGAPLADAWWC